MNVRNSVIAVKIQYVEQFRKATCNGVQKPLVCLRTACNPYQYRLNYVMYMSLHIKRPINKTYD